MLVSTAVEPATPSIDSNTSPVTKTFVPSTHNLWIIPIPAKKQYHPDRAFKFGLGLNLLFGFAATFTVANLYYNQPILSILAEDWNVEYDTISRVPTLLQCGYAVGILLLAPLGDMVRRRGLVLLLIALTATLSIGLAKAPNLITFEVLGFFIAVLTVSPSSRSQHLFGKLRGAIHSRSLVRINESSPQTGLTYPAITAQIMVPLTADLAPPESRSKAISITLSGLMLGVLVARVISGIIAEFSDWRNVYWMSVGLQYLILLMLWWALPDYPAKVTDVGYWQIVSCPDRGRN
jgi:MFS family permease